MLVKGPQVIKSTIAHLVVFFYIYSIRFAFLPISASTTLIFGVIGFILFSLRLVTTQSQLINKKYLYYFFYVFILILIVFISITYNKTDDYEMLTYVIYFAVTFFSSYFVIIFLTKIDYEVNFDSVSNLIINAIFIQSIIALGIFYFPGFSEFIYRIEKIDGSALDQINHVSAFRLTGFGTRFFEAGVISGIALILLGFKIRINHYSANKLLILVLKFLFIFTIGSMMARTTIVGAFLGVLLILAPKDLRMPLSFLKKTTSFLSLIVILPSIIYIALITNNRVKELVEPVFNYAFELLINYFREGRLESESTNQLKDMYILPSQIKTWIIGDGYWSNPAGTGYYMHIDVGFLRMIYYYGLPGLLVFLLIHYFSINLNSGLRSKKLIIIIFLLYLMIINLKGYIDITAFTLLLSMSSVICLRKKAF